MKYLIFLIFSFLLYACSNSQAGDAESEEAARLSYAEPGIIEVGTVPVRRGNFELELVSNGKLEARQKAVIPFVVQEQITSVAVQEGQPVSADQLLGQVDPFTYQKRLDDATNRYQQAVIDLEDRLLGHGYNLNDTASIPENILQMARIRSGYNTAVTALEEARRNLAQTAIRAPISGVVTNLEAKVNNPSVAYKQFCEILDLSVMHLVFHLLETELQQVQTGQTIEARPFALSDKSFTGKVVSINPAVDEQGMIRVTAEVPNPGKQLMDGMNVRVLLKNRVPNCLIIPKDAVLYRQNRQVVFIYEDGKAIWKYVKTSHESSVNVAISEGLEEGMQVIVENNLNLAHESQVTVISEK